MKDYYEILEVHPKASQDMIKKAYRILAKKYHPDLTDLDKEYAKQKMQEVNEAYSILSDPDKRAEYDNRGKTRNTNGTTSSGSDYTQNSRSYTEDEIRFQDICFRYLDVLKDAIVRDNSHTKANFTRCDKLYKNFSMEIAAVYSKLVADGLMHGEIAEIYYVTIKVFALSYTWGGGFAEAAKVIKLANGVLDKDSEFYDECKKLIIKLQQEADTAERMKPSVMDWILDHLKLIFYGGLLLVVGWNFLFGDSSKKSTSVPKSNVAQQKSFNKATQNLKPRVGITTGYDKSFKQLNYGGYCKLTIDNTQNDEPVYLRLWSVSPTKPVRAVFIAAHDKVTMEKITPGNYEIRYKYLFEKQEAERGTKSQTFNMKQEHTDTGVRYSVQSITLYKVRNGNFRTDSIDAADI